MDKLPDHFDVIVVGTGMPECIIAAAAARIGKKVLHLDKNGYYGGDWASFSYDKFLEWMDEVKQNDMRDPGNECLEDADSFLQEEEHLVTCPVAVKSVSNLICNSYIRDVPELPPAEPHDGKHVTDISETNLSYEASLTKKEDTNDAQDTSEEKSEQDILNDAANKASISNDAQSPVEPMDVAQEWTLSSFMENRRKFNIDLAPKLLFARGSLVELLISSNIARYAEFQCISRVLTYINDRIEQVPCSRADVFSTKNVSVVEKRMLMKFLTFCLKYEEQEEEYKDYKDKSFVNFLRSKKLTTNVEHYIMHAIAMVDDSCTTLQGLKAAQKFLESLGRYGKTPFLCTCYGSAELPQCFCRMCAVYEGMYYLKRKADAIIFKDDACCGIITMGQRINCQWLVMESNYAPASFVPENSKRISRAILVSDSSLCPSEHKESTILRFPSSENNITTIIELSSKNYVCPEDLYLVYMFCPSSKETAEDDLKPIIDLLYNSDKEKDSDKPNLLWSVFFNQNDTSSLSMDAPKGVFLTSSPDIELDYEHTVKEAREIFALMYPGEEFLPRAPDPEDILIESVDNPGEEETGKIENDVKDDSPSGENDTKENDKSDGDCQDRVTEECDISSSATEDENVIKNSE